MNTKPKSDKKLLSALDIVLLIDDMKCKSSAPKQEALSRIKDIVTKSTSDTVYPTELLINFLKIESETYTELREGLIRLQLGRKPNVRKNG